MKGFTVMALRKLFLRISVVCLIAMLSSSCSQKVAPPTNWTGEKEGVILHIQSDPGLNKIDGGNYTLYLVVYQLKDPNPFNQLTANEEGLFKLLESNIFDPSVTAVNSIVIYPGSDVTHKIDRALDTRYLAVVAGYNTMEKGQMVRMFDIPVKTLRHGFLKSKKEILADTLNLSIHLGPDQIGLCEIVNSNGVEQ